MYKEKIIYIVFCLCLCYVKVLLISFRLFFWSIGHVLDIGSHICNYLILLCFLDSHYLSVYTFLPKEKKLPYLIKKVPECPIELSAIQQHCCFFGLTFIEFAFCFGLTLAGLFEYSLWNSFIKSSNFITSFSFSHWLSVWR